MRAIAAKRVRREARRQLSRHTHVEARWWARPRVFKAWSLAGAVAVKLAVRLGWRGLGARWAAFMRAAPARGIRFVVN